MRILRHDKDCNIRIERSKGKSSMRCGDEEMNYCHIKISAVFGMAIVLTMIMMMLLMMMFLGMWIQRGKNTAQPTKYE